VAHLPCATESIFRAPLMRLFLLVSIPLAGYTPTIALLVVSRNGETSFLLNALSKERRFSPKLEPTIIDWMRTVVEHYSFLASVVVENHFYSMHGCCFWQWSGPAISSD
jgi:hypothetical protein